MKTSNNCYVIKLRNPWAKAEWKGKWHRTDPIWTKKLRRELDYPSNAKRGMFCMEVGEFIKYFPYI